MEIFHHIFGTCGDGHWTIWHGLGAIGAGITYAYNHLLVIKMYIVNLFKSKTK